MVRTGVHQSLTDIEKDLFKPEPFVLQLGTFGTMDVMPEYDKMRSHIEIVMYIIFGVTYERQEQGIYDKEDVYGTRPEYKEGRLCSLITYMVRLFSYKKKEGSA